MHEGDTLERVRLGFWVMVVVCWPCTAQLTQSPFPADSAQLVRADVAEILGLLCPGQEYSGQESGCRVCPASTKRAGARGEAPIVSAVRGHFLKADSDDLLVDLYGCGAVLLAHSSSGWFVERAAELPEGACRKVATRGSRDGLVCYESASTPEREDGRLTFAYLPEQKSELLAVRDSTGGACDAPKRLVVQSAIQDVKFIPGASGKMTLTISARCRRGPLSERSRKACERGPGFEDIGPAVAFRSFRIDYLFDGEKFSLAAASRAVKQAYDSCSAETK